MKSVIKASTSGSVFSVFFLRTESRAFTSRILKVDFKASNYSVEINIIF